MPSKKPRKTYYRIADGEIQKVRRTIPPEGWTRDLAKLKLELKAKQVPLVKIGGVEKQKVPTNQEDSSVEELTEQLEAERQQVRALRSELATLKRRTETDQGLRKRIEEERREKRLQELDRAAEFAKHNNGIKEDEYYRVKNLAQGLQQRIQALTERHEELQHTYQSEHSKRLTTKSQAERLDNLLALLYAALRKLYRSSDSIISKLPPIEQGDHRRKFDRVFNQCQNALTRASWRPQDHELPTF